jgi:hypothetical protein
MAATTAALAGTAAAVAQARVMSRKRRRGMPPAI